MIGHIWPLCGPILGTRTNEFMSYRRERGNFISCTCKLSWYASWYEKEGNRKRSYPQVEQLSDLSRCTRERERERESERGRAIADVTLGPWPSVINVIHFKLRQSIEIIQTKLSNQVSTPDDHGNGTPIKSRTPEAIAAGQQRIPIHSEQKGI